MRWDVFKMLVRYTQYILVSNVENYTGYFCVKAFCILGTSGCHCKMLGVKLWMAEWGN